MEKTTSQSAAEPHAKDEATALRLAEEFVKSVVDVGTAHSDPTTVFRYHTKLMAR